MKYGTSMMARSSAYVKHLISTHACTPLTLHRWSTDDQMATCLDVHMCRQDQQIGVKY